MRAVLVPLMIALSGAFMSVAWLGHLRIRHLGFWVALGLSWMIVLPEYVLNVLATRYGHGTYTGAQMAGFHLASGVVCVTLVSRYLLGEPLNTRHISGLVFLTVGMLLLLSGEPGAEAAGKARSVQAEVAAPPVATSAE